MDRYQIKRERAKLDFEETLADLKEKGWRFKSEDEVEHHNGNEYTDWFFKSPDLKKFHRTYRGIRTDYGWEIDLKELFKDELNARVKERTDRLFEEYTGVLDKLKDVILKIAKEYINKEKRIDDKTLLIEAIERYYA